MQTPYSTDQSKPWFGVRQNGDMSHKFRRIVTLVVLFGFVATGLVAAIATK